MNKNANTSRSFLLKIINQEMNQKLNSKLPMKINHLTPKEHIKKFDSIQIQFDNPVVAFSPQCEVYQEIKINRSNTKPNSVKINETFLLQKSKDILHNQSMSSSPVEDEIMKSPLNLETSDPVNKFHSFFSFTALNRQRSSSVVKQSLLYLKNTVRSIKCFSLKTCSKSNNSNSPKNKCRKMKHHMSLFLQSNSQGKNILNQYYPSKKDDHFSKFANQKFTEIAMIYIQ